METSRETHHEIVTPTSGFSASNDNLRSQLSFGRSLFPADAVAAARSRALNRGAEPRLDRQGLNASELALLEIATGGFFEDELAPYLFPSSAGAPLLAAPSTTPEFRGDGRSSAAAAPVSYPQEAVH